MGGCTRTVYRVFLFLGKWDCKLVDIGLPCCLAL